MKRKLMVLAVALITMAILTGCGADKGKSKANIKVFSSFQIGVPAVLHGGVMLYGHNSTNPTAGFVMKLASEGPEVELILDNGNWDFVVFGWTASPKGPMHGDVKCGKALNVNLSGGDVPVNITMISGYCSDTVFNNGIMTAESPPRFPSLHLSSCNEFVASNLLQLNHFNNCAKVKTGYARSYKVIMPDTFGNSLQTLCLQNQSTGTGTATEINPSIAERPYVTDLNIPGGGGPYSPFYTILKAYQRDNCSGPFFEYHFPHGVNQGTSNPNNSVIKRGYCHWPGAGNQTNCENTIGGYWHAAGVGWPDATSNICSYPHVNDPTTCTTASLTWVNNDFQRIFVKTTDSAYCGLAENAGRSPFASSDVAGYNATFGGSTGDYVQDPHLICNETQLRNIVGASDANWPTTRNKHFKLLNHINFMDGSGASFMMGTTPTASSSTSTSYTKTFNGNNKSIIAWSGYTSSTATNAQGLGFIRHLGNTSESAIRDLTFIMPEISANDQDHTKVGTVAGIAQGDIYNVQVVGASVRGAYQYCGGLVGYGEGSEFSMVNSTVTDSDVECEQYAGGMAGKLFNIWDDAVKYGYVKGSRVDGHGGDGSSTQFHGGIAGELEATCGVSQSLIHDIASIDNRINASNSIGGILGQFNGGSTNCRIEDIYSTSSLNAHDWGNPKAGGLVGNMIHGTVTKGFFTNGGLKTGAASANGILGGYTSGNCTQVHSNIADSNCGLGTPRTYAQMRDDATYTGWNLTTTATTATYKWYMPDDPYDFPRFQWEDPRPCQGYFSNAPFADGSGSSSDPYVICSKAHFDNIPSYNGSYFELFNNIDLYGVNLNQAYFTTNFTGTLLGNNHKISNLTITATNPTNHLGLFRAITSTGQVKNLKLDMVWISLYTTSTPTISTGALAGNNNGYIYGVETSDGSIGKNYSACNTGTCSLEYVGGLVGYNSGTIEHSDGEVEVRADSHSGGLVGQNDGGTIKNSAAYNHVTTRTVYTGTMSASISSIGGLVGSNINGGLVKESYTYTNIEIEPNFHAVSRVGGLVGYNASGSSINDCLSVSRIYDSTEVFNTNYYPRTEYVGGLVGYNAGYINRSLSVATVTATSTNLTDLYSHWGMLVGTDTSSGTNITASYAADYVYINGNPETADTNTFYTDLLTTNSASTSTYTGNISNFSGWSIEDNDDWIFDGSTKPTWTLFTGESWPYPTNAHYSDEDVSYFLNYIAGLIPPEETIE